MDMCSPAAELLAQLLSRRAKEPHGVSGCWILYLDKTCVLAPIQSGSLLLDIHLKHHKTASHSSECLLCITHGKLPPDRSGLDCRTCVVCSSLLFLTQTLLFCKKQPWQSQKYRSRVWQVWDDKILLDHIFHEGCYQPSGLIT